VSAFWGSTFSMSHDADWSAACAYPGVRLHLYGKVDARPGRKMGHLTALAPTVEEATRLALEARSALAGAHDRKLAGVG